MPQLSNNPFAEELRKEAPSTEVLRPEIEKLVSSEDGALIQQAREWGATLTPNQIAKLIPVVLDYGIMQQCCNRSLFTLEVIVGASNSSYVLSEAGKTGDTLWERAYREVAKRPAYNGPNTFTPINAMIIPLSMVPKQDEATLPARPRQVWH